MKRRVSPPRLHTPLRAFGAAAALALGAYYAHVGFGFGGAGLNSLFDDVVYTGLILAAAVACGLRAALVPEERVAWLVMALGLASWTAAELFDTLFLSELDDPPFPSVGDALYLGFYPASYVTLMLLVRSRVKRFERSLWLDGLIGALAAAAAAAALGFEPIVESTSGDAPAIATNLAYPLADLVLLGFVVAVFGLAGWRPGRAWIAIGFGFAIMSVTHGIYLVQAAEGTYVPGTLLDASWPASALLVALSAWQPARIGEAPRIGGWRMVAVPFACALAALGLLTYDHFGSLNGAALVLTTTTLLLVTVRMALSYLDNQRMLARSRHEAGTDALTGLKNRRSLMADLEREARDASEGSPRSVVLFDLNGFKVYNDTFGHPAGDALLARLGGRLAAAIDTHGTAYRLGGDEFCALLTASAGAAGPLVSAATAALSDHGEGFHVSASYGIAAVPKETRDATEALQLADRRMYAQKGGRRSSVSRQTRDVLLRALHERQPDLHDHLRDVAELALAVGRELGMEPEQLDELARAAELHDVGKVAIPDAILNKPGPLDESEWSFMQRHTVIGERILGAAPALRPVARLVRCSHERWDGKGYPDGLAREEIPLGARIVAVCDAFDAMTAARPYRSSSEEEGALEELRRSSGTHFDPAVVEAFYRVVTERSAAVPKAAPGATLA
jgi:diguanylate cyclase (GGDEF)-like protein